MIKIKSNDKELSVHILQNPAEPSAVLFTLIGKSKQYDIVAKIDEDGFVAVGFEHFPGKTTWYSVIPESLEDEWVEVVY